ncbi:MAG: SH3 domain-containing protein [Proteobacteria bacterium]|nr:SH3 domain-containing protein [Pseudomonadota bacterium]
MHSHHLRLWVGAFLCTLSGAAMAENAVTTEVASVRAGPDDAYPEVAQLDSDSPVEVVGCLDDWSWCDVTFDGNRGWLYSPDITFEYEGGYVPFYTYAPAFSIPVISFTVDTYWGRYYHDRPWYRDRDEWSHREIQHRQPPGPRPRSGPPPREAVRMDRPHGGPPGDRSIRLGRAEPRPPSHIPSRDEREHREADAARERAETQRDRDQGDRRPPERSGDRAMPERTRDRDVPGSAAPDQPAPPHAASPRPAPPPMHTPPEHQPPEHQPPQHDAHAGERDSHEHRRDEPKRDEPRHHDEPRPPGS